MHCQVRNQRGIRVLLTVSILTCDSLHPYEHLLETLGNRAMPRKDRSVSLHVR
jgi:hypothetical protein